MSDVNLQHLLTSLLACGEKAQPYSFKIQKYFFMMKGSGL